MPLRRREGLREYILAEIAPLSLIPVCVFPHLGLLGIGMLVRRARLRISARHGETIVGESDLCRTAHQRQNTCKAIACSVN